MVREDKSADLVSCAGRGRVYDADYLGGVLCVRVILRNSKGKEHVRAAHQHASTPAMV